MGNLTAAQVRTLKSPGRYSDGRGLMLQVGKTGGRSWLVRVQFRGRRRDIGLGDAKLISLSKARDAADDIRRQVRTGIDPVAERRKEILVVPTFREAAAKVHKERLEGWKNGKHTDQWLTTLETYAYPRLGKLPVDMIEGSMIRDVLAKIWLDKPETARRVKQRIGAVLDWCYARGLRSTEAPMRSISKGLPRQPRKNGHFAAMPHAQLPTFFAGLQGAQFSVGRLALAALILTATRSGEIRGATWREFDEALTVWTIPAIRMKTGVEHRIPLSPQAKAVFGIARKLRGLSSDLVFPGQRRGKALSDMTLLKILRDMGVDATVHGFRSSFRDWVADETDYPREIAEAALAHTLANKIEAAYRRTDFFEKRRQLMNAWGKFCASASPRTKGRDHGVTDALPEVADECAA